MLIQDTESIVGMVRLLLVPIITKELIRIHPAVYLTILTCRQQADKPSDEKWITWIESAAS